MMRTPVSNLPIQFENASLCMGATRILDGVSLALRTGTSTVLIGPNGSGKTTLLRMAMGFVPPTAGRVTWDGQAQAPAERRAIMFQRPVMLRRSAAANVRYALRGAAPRMAQDARIRELLSMVGLEGFAARPARRLSGGEQQRLALARALASDPAVLFLDEPTASLDPAATKAMEDLIRLVAARGIKVVMSTHDLGEAKRLAGDIVLMHRGRIVENSDAAGFFARPQTDEARRFLAGELLV